MFFLEKEYSPHPHFFFVSRQSFMDWDTRGQCLPDNLLPAAQGCSYCFLVSFVNCFWSLMCFGSLKMPLPWTKLSGGPGYCEVGATQAKRSRVAFWVVRERLLDCGWKSGRAAWGKVWVQMTTADHPSLAHHPLPWLKRQGMCNKLQHLLSCMAYEVSCALWNTFVYDFFFGFTWRWLPL